MEMLLRKVQTHHTWKPYLDQSLLRRLSDCIKVELTGKTQGLYNAKTGRFQAG